MQKETRSERRARERKEIRNNQAISNEPSLVPKISRKNRYIPLIILFLFCLGSAFYVGNHTGRNSALVVIDETVKKPQVLDSERKFHDVFAIKPEDVSAYDMAELNLLCGSQLEGTHDINIAECLKQLDKLVEMVRAETERNWGRWQRNPAEYENSEAHYRMGMLITVIREDYKCKYNPDLIDLERPKLQNENIPDSVFFADASNVFLQGLLSGEKMGTCASMPVLYTAVARRLGYPVFLVASKGHLFCRWESDNERRNFEDTGQGITCNPDDYYKKFPRFISDDELAQGYYLKNLTPQQELAGFLLTRSACLSAHDQHIDSSISQLQAFKLSMNYGGYTGLSGTILQSETFRKIRFAASRIDAEQWIFDQWEKGGATELRKASERKKNVEGLLRNLLKENPQDKERIEGLMREEAIDP